MIGINSLRFENYNIIIIVPVNILYPPRPPSHPLIYVLNPNNSLRQFVDEIVQKKKKITFQWEMFMHYQYLSTLHVFE